MTEPLELSIDTASEMASVALTREGVLVAELTWQAGREHSSQLLAAVDGLLARQGASQAALSAVFACTGPGSYAGIRSGLSAAKGLAFALEVPIVGVGRLEIEAYAFAAAGRPVAAVQRAGRSELAWAVYEGAGNKEQGTGGAPPGRRSGGIRNQKAGSRPPSASPEAWREIVAPGLATADALLDALPGGALVTGEIEDALAERLVARGHRVVRGAAALRRAALLAELAWQRLQAGRADDPKTLVPLYLREPAIGPQQ